MKLKEFGPPGGGGARPKFYYVDPPLYIVDNIANFVYYGKTPLTYTVYPWSVHSECALMQK